MKIFLVSMAIAVMLFLSPGFFCFGILLYYTIACVSKYGKTGEELEREVKRPAPPVDLGVDDLEDNTMSYEDMVAERMDEVKFKPNYQNDPKWQKAKAGLDKHMKEQERKRFAQEGAEEQTA